MDEIEQRNFFADQQFVTSGSVHSAANGTTRTSAEGSCSSGSLEAGRTSVEAMPTLDAAPLGEGSGSPLRDAKRQLRKALGWSQDFDDVPLERLMEGAAKQLVSLGGIFPKQGAPLAAGSAQEPSEADWASFGEWSNGLKEWIDAEQRRPNPEVLVLCWDGKKTFVDWFGSKHPREFGVTHWMPYPLPPGCKYDMHDGRRA